MEFFFDLQRFNFDLSKKITLKTGVTKDTNILYIPDTAGVGPSAMVAATSAIRGSITLTAAMPTGSTAVTAEKITRVNLTGQVATGTSAVILSAAPTNGITVNDSGKNNFNVGNGGLFTATLFTVSTSGNLASASNLAIASGVVKLAGTTNVSSLASAGTASYTEGIALSNTKVVTSAGTVTITEKTNNAATTVRQSTAANTLTVNSLDSGGYMTVNTKAGVTSAVIVGNSTFNVKDMAKSNELVVYSDGDKGYLTKGVVGSTSGQGTTSFIASGTSNPKTSKIVFNTSGFVSVSGGKYTISGMSSNATFAIDGKQYTYKPTTNTVTDGNGTVYVIGDADGVIRGTINGDTVGTTDADTLNIVQGTDLGAAVTKTAGTSADIYGNESTTLYQFESAGKIYTTSTNNASNGTYLNSVSYDSKTGKYKFDASNSNVGQDLHDFANFASVIGGKGADSIQADLGGNNDGFVLNSGAGADNVTMAAAGNALGSDWKITTGAGKDTITLDENLTYNVTGWKIDGGEDDDVITVGATAVDKILQSSIAGGAGKDTITNYGTDNTLTGGAGADTFNISVANAKANISDYKLGEDLIQVSVDPTTALTSGMFGTDGTITDAATGKATIKGSGFYAAQLTNADKKKQYVGWVGENATKIDGSNMADSVILYGTKNEAGDLLLGGAKKDTVYAGAGDSVYGGVGNDSVVVNGAGVYVGVATNGGADSVSGFTTGFDTETADQLYMVNGSVSQVTIANNGSGNIKFSNDSGSVSLSGAASTGNGYAGLLVSGKKVYSIEDSATLTIDDSTELADFYFGTKGETGKGSAVDLSGFTSVLSVDLSNTNVYHNLTSIKGGAGTTSLIGSAGAESLAGGAGVTSLWGGNGGKDTLVSGTASTEFFFASGGGNDVVEGFKNTDGAEDTLNFFGGDLASVARTGDQEVKVSVSDGSTLTIGTAESGTDTKLTWKSGDASGVAKVGSIAGANSFTYERDVTNYIGGNKQDVLTVNDDAGNVNVWLDGSQGASYSDIDVMNATSSTGNIQLAGDNASQSIVGGQGNTSLWGGAGNATDTLVGGSGVNEFFYLMGNGNDVISGNATDTVNLLDIKLSDLAAANIDTSSNRVIFTTKANETVTVSGSVQNFKLGDGSAWVADYTGENGSWSAKN